MPDWDDYKYNSWEMKVFCNTWLYCVITGDFLDTTHECNQLQPHVFTSPFCRCLKLCFPLHLSLHCQLLPYCCCSCFECWSWSSKHWWKYIGHAWGGRNTVSSILQTSRLSLRNQGPSRGSKSCCVLVVIGWSTPSWHRETLIGKSENFR